MREATEIFDICKSDLERYGSQLWEMTLRRKPFKKLNLLTEEENKEPTDLIITTDLPRAFYCSSLAGEKKNLQIIRKPIITDPVASIMNNSIDSKCYTTSHQRILNLKTIGDNMQSNNNSLMQSQLQNSILVEPEKQILDQLDLNISNEFNPLQNEPLTERQNHSVLNQSKFNQNTNINTLTTHQNTQGSEIIQNIQNKTLTQGMIRESSLPTLKQNQLQTKNTTLNQSDMSVMNLTFMNASNLQQPFKSFRASEYYNKRLGEIKDIIKDYKTICEQNADYQGLAVIGVSQFEREVEMVKRADEYTLFNKFKLEKEEDNSKTDDLF